MKAVTRKTLVPVPHVERLSEEEIEEINKMFEETPERREQRRSQPPPPRRIFRRDMRDLED